MDETTRPAQKTDDYMASDSEDMQAGTAPALLLAEEDDVCPMPACDSSPALPYFQYPRLYCSVDSDAKSHSSVVSIDLFSFHVSFESPKDTEL